jgi:hypothetical protein
MSEKAKYLSLTILITGMFSEVITADVNDDITEFGLDSTETVSKGGLDWIIHYNDDSASDHYVSSTQASETGVFLDTLYDRQLTDMGFGDYYSSTTDDGYFDILLFNLDVLPADHWRQGIYGYYCGYEFGLNSQKLSDPPSDTDRKVTAHELFHAIQKGYRIRGGATGSIYGSVVSEGQARAMDDRWEAAFDWNTGGSSLYLDGASEIFLDDYTDSDFWKIGTDEDTRSPKPYPYSAGLFWSYLCEQLGNEINALNNGYDWIRRFYEEAESLLSSGEDVDQEILTDEAIQWFSRGKGEDFDSMYFDFAICNYARDYDQSALDFDTRYRSSSLVPRYEYRDEKETDTSGASQDYGSVSGAVNTTTSATGGSFLNESVSSNSAKYFEWDLTGALNAVKCQVIGVRCETDDSANICIMGITETGSIIDLQKTTGTSAARSYLVSEATATNDRIAKITVVVTGRSNGVDDLDIWFDLGEAVLKVSHPSQSNMAFPGVHDDPENFLVRLLVEGPADLIPDGFGNLSIQGLIQSDFEVRVNGLSATIKSSAYVGGEYWLMVEAPVQVADGLYGLEVALCSGAQTVRKNLSVLYGDYLFRHVVCLDVSGSMDFPATKLAAAKQAALFYVDTVRDNHRIGLVSFSGDGTEPNLDAVDAAAGQLLPAIPVIRLLVKIGINNYTAGGTTSIGDGLTVSQDIIDADLTAGELIDTILLLSDGAQNEAALWDGGPVTQRFVGAPSTPGNETIINTLSFGSNADTNLMQDIASSTDGDHTYIEVSTGALKSRSNTGSMFLNLATAYLAGTEKAQQLERLSCTNDSVRAGDRSEVTLDLSDSKVEDGMVYIYWDGDPGALDVTLFDPIGQEVSTPEADVFPSNFDNDERHRVWQMNALLKTGQYTLRIVNRSEKLVPYFAGISGRPLNQVKCELAFSSYLRSSLTSRTGGPRQKFGIGQPVTLLAFLSDRDGAIARNAMLDVEVTLPTGEVACGPVRMFDDGEHGDGVAGDGVYGAFFRQTLWGQTAGTDTDKDEPSAPLEANGAYRVNIIASGEANDGTGFLRHVNGTFTVYDEGEQAEGFDEDQDGLPTSWEISQGTDPKIRDEAEDPDEDGLTNLEEYKLGTLAFNADTDHGGESDGSEIARGRCPLNEGDDSIRFSNQLSVWSNTPTDDGTGFAPVPGTNRLLLPLIRSWKRLQLQRTIDPNSSPWATIASIETADLDEPLYKDAGLVPGTKYYYRMRGTRSTTGAVSAWSNAAWGIPIDNRPPIPTPSVALAAVGGVLAGELAASDADSNAVLSFALDTPVAGLIVNPNGSFQFDGNDPAYNALSPGDAIEVIANWTVTDNLGGTASSTLTITVSGTRGLLGDSALEFSGIQGQDNWHHGYRNYTLDGGGDDYDPATAFISFDPGMWRTPANGNHYWRLPNQNGAPWTLLGRTATHPNGTNSTPNEEHWTVRRWVPADLDGTTPVAITWGARKTNRNADGVTGSLHINGVMVDSRVVPGNDTTGEFRTYYANLTPGDIVDLALSPEGVANRSDGSDSSATRFWVSNVIPANPVQPDGAPFVPFQTASFSDWASTFGLTGNDAATDASPAGDGIANLLKYAFNMDPTVSYTGEGRFLEVGVGDSGLPVIRITESNGEERLQIEFVRRRNTDSLICRPQVSDDLLEWQNLDTIPSVTEIDDQWERVVVEDALTRDEHGTRFVRLLVELAE